MADASTASPCDEPGALTFASMRAYVETLPHGFDYEPMSLEQSNAMALTARALTQGTVEDARASAGNAGYEIVPLRAGASCHWVVRPTAAAPKGHASFVFALTFSRDLIVEAPHVPSDKGTDLEAAILFETVGAKVLAIAGAQRCAVTTPSGCHSNVECSSQGIAVESDIAHSVHSALHAVHVALTAGSGTAIGLQLHANVDTTLNGAALVSNGTRFVIAGTPADALFAALHAPDVDVRSCNDPAAPPSAGAFCGETNSQGLANNGAVDACLGRPISGGGPSIHRFIHLEQSYQTLVAVDAWAARVADALRTAIAPVP